MEKNYISPDARSNMTPTQTKQSNVEESLKSLQKIRERIDNSEAKQKEEQLLKEAEAIEYADLNESVDKF